MGAELDSEQRRMSDAHKNFRKAERGIKEFTFKEAEDRKNAERMSDLVEKLQQQIKTYKKQIEEAEEIAAINLSKFRKAQVDLTETQERADLSLLLLRSQLLSLAEELRSEQEQA